MKIILKLLDLVVPPFSPSDGTPLEIIVNESEDSIFVLILILFLTILMILLAVGLIRRIKRIK